jgi:hypothetical protein
MPVSSACFQRHDPRPPAHPTRPYRRRPQVSLAAGRRGPPPGAGTPGRPALLASLIISAVAGLRVRRAPLAADAGKEGGFMGFGGEQVSAGEQRMLDQVRAALG